MKFCRHCGTVLAGAPAPSPYAPPPYAPPPQAYAPPPPPPPYGPPPSTAPGMGLRPAAPGGVVAGSIGGAPSGPGIVRAEEPRGGIPSACPRCGAPTQPGFAFCQQCGMKLNAPPAGVDALAGTIASQGPIPAAPAPAPASPPQPSPIRAAAAIAPTPSSGAWGAAVSVNRDGTDGERFDLSSEFVIVGRTSADISFEQDRFLARHHARIEQTLDGQARVVPLDHLNGVFRKIDAAVELVDGSVILAGREVLRYEIVEAEERSPAPLLRHGVALFGSPPREPWGRLVQLLPSGGVRDVRHLWDDEIVIGREDGDLVFSDDQFLSRRHAAIKWDGARAHLTDLGSSNGTFIRLTGPTAIKHGDHLRMGDQLFRIELKR